MKQLTKRKNIIEQDKALSRFEKNYIITDLEILGEDKKPFLETLREFFLKK